MGFYCRHFVTTVFVESNSFRVASGNLPKNFPDQEINWNYSILRSEHLNNSTWSSHDDVIY